MVRVVFLCPEVRGSKNRGVQHTASHYSQFFRAGNDPPVFTITMKAVLEPSPG